MTNKKNDSMHISDLEPIANQCEKEQRTILIKFGAIWCGPCKNIEPAFDQLMRECFPDILVLKIDIDKSPDLAELFEVERIPSFRCLLPTAHARSDPQDLRHTGSNIDEIYRWLLQIV